MYRLQVGIRSKTLDRLRYFDWIRRPTTGSTLLLNVSDPIDVGWVYRAAVFGTIEALHVTTLVVIGYNQSYRFYYFEED